MLQIRNLHDSRHILRKGRNRILVIDHNDGDAAAAQAASDREAGVIATDDDRADLLALSHRFTASRAVRKPGDIAKVIEGPPCSSQSQRTKLPKRILPRQRRK